MGVADPSEAEPDAPRPLAQLALRSRIASVGVIVVLLAVSCFAIWSSTATAATAKRAATASRISNSFADAATAVAAEELLEREYRITAAPGDIARYDDVTRSMTLALGQVRATGRPSDRALAERLLVQHAAYVRSVRLMFAATDRGNTVAADRIESTENDPAFEVIQHDVLHAAEVHRSASLAQLARLRSLERRIRWLTPTVFVLGLALAALLALGSRGYRRVLINERARAVHDSLHDTLTGLPNRALLVDRLTQALRIAKRSGNTVGLLLVNLDRFREVNDTYGHEYGDRLLTQFGSRLVSLLRTSDSVARLGGDEFAVLLPVVNDLPATLAIAAKLRHALDRPFPVHGVELDVEASIGVVLSGEHGDDAATLLQRVDVAMHVAKTRNLGVLAYHPEVDSHSPTRLALLGELRRALERNEFILHYQPKVNVSSGALVGVEALVRWQHPTRGMVLPDDFIPVAEHTGLIGPLTRYVLQAALVQSRLWADSGRALQISVNLSARNLLDERLPEKVTALLVEHGVAASMLELEVTESAITTEPGRARRLLERVAALGVRLSIDDFGAGYTSLGQLKTLPMSELKIDRSFVMTMHEHASDALIVRSIVDLGHNLGLTIVAEGVETAEALFALNEIGCDVAQGNYICQPAGIEAFDAWRRDRAGGFPQARVSTKP